MFLQFKALLASMAGIVAAFATWLLVDASGLVSGDFLYRGDNNVGGASGGFFVYQFAFAILFSLMIAAADAVYRDSAHQRKTNYLVAIGCGLAGGLIGPGIGLGFSALFPAPAAAPDGASGAFLFNVFLLSLGWAVVGAAAGAIPGIARKSMWIAQRGALGGACGTIFGATLFHLSASIFDTDLHSGLAWRLGSVVLMGTLSGLGSSLIPDLTRRVWLRAVGKSGWSREYIVGRSPFRLGKDPTCDVVLADSTTIAPVHILIEAIPQTKRHRLRHAARAPGGNAIYAPTELNDEAMTSEKWLKDGDIISIGKVAFSFHEVATHAEEPERPRFEPAHSRDELADLQSKTTAIPISLLPAALAADTGAGTIAAQDLTTGALPGLLRAQVQTSSPSIDRQELAPTSKTQPPSTGPISSAGDAGLKIIGTRLACIGGPYLGQSFPLSHHTALIGRSLDHAIALPADTSVSRVHARIVYEGGRHVISDDGSSNGLLVNDILVTQPVTLNISDVITVGGTILRYE